MKKYANKAKLGKVEKLLSSRMDKISENLTKNTNSINSSKTKLEEVANSLSVLQSNMSTLWLGGVESVTTSNVSANDSTILEQLNATRYYSLTKPNLHLCYDTLCCGGMKSFPKSKIEIESGQMRLKMK